MEYDMKNIIVYLSYIFSSLFALFPPADILSSFFSNN